MYFRLLLSIFVAGNLVIILNGAEWGGGVAFFLPFLVNVFALVAVVFFKRLTLVWIYLTFFAIALVLAALFGPADALGKLAILAFLLLAKFVLAFKAVNSPPLVFANRLTGRK